MSTTLVEGAVCSGARSRRRGFALVITVILLALLLLVLVSTATLTQIESSIGSNRLERSNAQRHALYALNVALGEVQRHLGPDQRITAEAGILDGVPVYHPHWTGVWNSQGGGLRTWLVSGNEDLVQPTGPATDVSDFDQELGRGPIFRPNMPGERRMWGPGGWSDWDPLDSPANPDGREEYLRRREFRIGSDRSAALMVGPYTAHYGSGAEDRYVLAPVIDLEGDLAGATAPATVGRYAWWVGDEGVKARVNLVDPRTKPSDSYYAATVDDLPDSVMRHQMAQRVGGESLTGLSGLMANDTMLERVLDVQQLAFAGESVSAVRARFHDITVHSAGVLSNAIEGGLKFDLSPFLQNGEAAVANTARLPKSPTFSGRKIVPSDADSPTFGLFRSWWELGGGAPNPVDWQTYRAAGSAPELLERPGVFPVVVSYSLFFGISRTTSTSNIRMHVVPLINIWNPYSQPLSSSDFRVEISIPSLNVNFIQPTANPSYRGNLTPPSTLVFKCRANVWPNGIGPGRSLLFSVSTSDEGGGWAQYDNGGDNFLAPTWNPENAFYFVTSAIWDAAAGGAVTIDQRGSAPSLTFFLGTGTGTPLQVLGSVGYSDEEVGGSDVGANESGVGVKPPTVFYANMVAHGWYLAPFNRTSAAPGAMRPIPYRSIPFNNWIPYDASVVGDEHGFAGASIWRPGNVPSAVGGDSGFPRAILFQLPVAGDPVFSFLDFQHVVRRRATAWSPSYLFRDSATDVEAALWDPYYLSAIPNDLADTDISASSFSLPNGRLKLVVRNNEHPVASELRFDAGVAGSNPMETSAGHLLFGGAFNVNSTSVEAWRAMLSSFEGVPVATRSSPVAAGASGHPYSRFSYPGADGLDTSVSSPANTPEAWAGYRRLTDAQIDWIANGAASLKRPFLSLADFATGPGFATSALAGSINPPDVEAIPNGSSSSPAADIPGRLTRADILSLIGPVLTVRSDTFRIRAYGEAVNPVTEEIEARAWCEAIVQRAPDYVNSNPGEGMLEPWEIPQAGTDNAKFGRRFKIVQFRWLSPEDI